MKMVMAVVPKEEANEVINELVAGGHTATFMESKGGALRETSETLYIAVANEELDQVLGIIDRYCHSSVCVAKAETAVKGLQGPTATTAQVGGAVVFVWELERFHRHRV